jgi:hypothetical protein
MALRQLTLNQKVILTFVGVVAIGILVAFALRQFSTPEENCTKQCAALKKSGRLVANYPASQTAGMRSQGPTHCECF